MDFYVKRSPFERQLEIPWMSIFCLTELLIRNQRTDENMSVIKIECVFRFFHHNQTFTSIKTPTKFPTFFEPKKYRYRKSDEKKFGHFAAFDQKLFFFIFWWVFAKCHEYDETATVETLSKPLPNINLTNALEPLEQMKTTYTG